MQLWFVRGSEVTIREQLVTQVVLGILSDDLAPGQRLPSTIANFSVLAAARCGPSVLRLELRGRRQARAIRFVVGEEVHISLNRPR